jgi:multidrug efflux system membrane fusion protein
VRLLVDTLNDVIVVPTAAVQRGPNGMFVYIVRDDDTVVMRPVMLSLQDESLTVIASGVQVGERVVTTSFNQLSDGRKVSLGNAEPAAAPGTSPAPAPGADRPRSRNNDGAAQTDQPRRDGQRRSERTEGTSRTP